MKNKSNSNCIPREKSRTRYILGDSTIKKLNGYFFTKIVRHKDLIKFWSVLGSKASCMVAYVMPTLWDDKPVHTLQAGISDFPTEKTSHIAKSIMDLITSLIRNDNLVIVSGIILQQ